jgi:hypothetical protein
MNIYSSEINYKKDGSYVTEKVTEWAKGHDDLETILYLKYGPYVNIISTERL